MTTADRPKSRLEAHAPPCPLCKEAMKVRTLLPGRKADDVAYRCEQCGEEVIRSVPRVWGSVVSVPTLSGRLVP
jgi:predicted RNA-binding Zn-ribbon protein involved in translation (DUF1610 family)